MVVDEIASRLVSRIASSGLPYQCQVNRDFLVPNFRSPSSASWTTTASRMCVRALQMPATAVRQERSNAMENYLAVIVPEEKGHIPAPIRPKSVGG